MTFLAPGRLWLLGLIPVLIAAYVLLQYQRRRYAVRFTNLALLGQVAPRRPGWRRHVPAALFLAMLVILAIGYARPAGTVKTPRDRAVIMVAIDVSLSMEATDVSPSRIEAAKAEAKKFIRQLPARFNVGVVGFAGSADVVAAPSADRDTALASVDQLQLDKRTAIGEAVFTSLQAIRTFDAQAESDPPPAHIVLMSDGDNTTGRSVTEAIDAARAANVPVSTIAFGTPYGSVTIDGETTPVEVNKQTLATLADGTKGKSYEAQSAGQLSDVYANIGTSLGFKTEHRDITDRFTGIGLLLAMASGILSLAWLGRLP
jgi:Ca-activated chloride channel family protein